GSVPIGVAVTPDGKFVFVVNSYSENVTVIATATNTVVATVGVGKGPQGVAPQGVAVTPDGKFVYVTNLGIFPALGTVSAIATASNPVTATVGLGSVPLGVTVSPGGKFVYAANEVSDTVSVIATSSNTATATVGVGSGPFGVAATPDGKFV